MNHAALLRASKDDGTKWPSVVEGLLPGAHVVLLGDSPSWELSSFRARKAGLSVRDAVAVVTPKGILFATLLRKDLDEPNIAKQLLKTGTGALNVDASRVYTDWNEPDRPDSWMKSGHSAKPDAEKIAAPPGIGINCHPKGRWPSNLTFIHATGCTESGSEWKCSSGCPSASLESKASGASRYYMQFKDEAALVAYLRTLILPEGGQLLSEFP